MSPPTAPNAGMKTDSENRYRYSRHHWGYETVDQAMDETPYPEQVTWSVLGAGCLGEGRLSRGGPDPVQGILVWKHHGPGTGLDA